MSEFKNIDYARYDEDEVKGSVKVLAVCFNAAASVVLTNSTYDIAELKISETVEAAKLIFQDISGQQRPLYLDPADQTYLMLAFMQIAAKMDKYVSIDTPLLNKELSKRSNELFEGAVNKKLISPVPSDLL
jgi:hypothetical protein